MTAPTLLDYAESTFSGTGSSETTDDLDWAASGDRVVALGVTEDNSETISTPTATGLTFSALSGLPTNTGSSCKGYGWSATASGNNNSAIAATTSIGIAAGISAWAFSGSDGLGTPVVPTPGASNVASVTIAQADSSVVMVLGDWNATTDVTVTTEPAGGTVREITMVSGRCTMAVVEWHDQATGTRDYGLNNWTGTGTVTRVAVEVKGAAGGAISLTVQDAAQAQLADSPTLTQVHVLVVADATHGQLADSPTLTQAHVLAVADAAQGQVADSPALTQVHILAVADAGQAQTADQIVLTQVHLLAVADAVHGQAADQVTLTGGAALTVADAVHGQVADSPTLTQVHTLVVADAVHGQTAEQVALTSGVALTVADAVHAQTADSPTLAQVHILAVADVTQGQVADSPTLTQVHVLAVADARQVQRADNVVLVVLDLLSRGAREVMIDGQTRRLLIDAQTQRVQVVSQTGRVSI